MALVTIEGLDRNRLICGNNAEELPHLPRESVDLAYADPPFFSNRHYEVVWGDEAEVRSYKDRWEGGIEHYIDWMRFRVQAIYDVLKPTGSFYLHCDWHATAHLRLLLDEIFGAENFQNEIIWCYNVGGKSKTRYARKHDTIYFYTKSKKWFFDGAAAGLKRETGDKSFGGILGVDKQGRRYQDKLVKASGKYYRYYLDDPKIPEDWWPDINSIQSQSAERVGYPTQKPHALLKRIILVSSRKNDLVLDPFCGCGTTVAAAQELGRRWIGIDISPTAIKVIRKVLTGYGAQEGRDYIVCGMPATLADLKRLEPFEFQNWVINEMRGRQSPRKVHDMGLDGTIPGDMFRPESGVQVKQSPDVGRKIVDEFETALARKSLKKGYIVAFSFTKGAIEEVARLKNEKTMTIILVTVADLLYKRAPLNGNSPA